MDDNKRAEIKAIIEADIDNENICKEIELGYIFGTYGNNEHYRIDDIVAIRNEILYPVVEEVIEEPIVVEE